MGEKCDKIVQSALSHISEDSSNAALLKDINVKVIVAVMLPIVTQVISQSEGENVIVSAIKETSNEAKQEDTTAIIVKMAGDIGVNINSSDVSTSYWIGKKKTGDFKPKMILARFVWRETKINFVVVGDR